jgi:hypothetical protein
VSAPTDPLDALLELLDGGANGGDGGVIAKLSGLADACGGEHLPKVAALLDAIAERLSAATIRAREHVALGDTAVMSLDELPRRKLRGEP